MNDAEILHGCLQQDRRAQRALYEKHLPYLLAIIRRYGVTGADIQDVVQEAFTEIFTTLTRFDPTVGPIRPWLARITIHRTLNHFRRTNRLHAKVEEAHTEWVSAPPEVLDNASVDAILAEINRLPPAYRLVFNLYVVDGYSHAEIGELLGITPEGSRTRFNRARIAMRKRLGTFAKNLP